MSEDISLCSAHFIRFSLFSFWFIPLRV